MCSPLLLAWVLLIPLPTPVDPLTDAPRLAARIDALVAKHWQDNNVQPAPLADDAAFLRRLTLDLAGRIPTVAEAEAFVADRSADKRSRAIRRLMQSPEYALQLGRTLDEIIQEKYAGKTELLDYLRDAVAAHESWDHIFRDLLLGPWDTKERKRANQFLAKRLNSLDDLTNDTARVFFGVNVSCAKCHDHPLVPDWTQDHYYGMASFFNPTLQGSRGKRNGLITEKTTDPVSFVTTKGVRRTARVMFLSGHVLSELTKQGPASRREQLVQVALEDRSFFSKALVNRLWANLLGRGLVQPLDQMHSANPPAIPELLEYLADDFANHGYHIDRLIAGLVSSRVYQLASTSNGEEVGDKLFARALLRPLTPQQFAASLVLATQENSFDLAESPNVRRQHYRDLEGRVTRLTRSEALDKPSDRFQSSAGEALFLSNNPDVQQLFAPAGKNLVARLLAVNDNQELVTRAVWALLSRPPEAEEKSYLVSWLNSHGPDRAKACADLVWALAASAEFRFNH
jgi:hypothetical protein